MRVGELATELTADLATEQRTLLDAELERLAAFIDDTRFKVGFPAPNQRDLLD